MADRVLIYLPTSKEWYRAPNLGVTRNRDEAHRYTPRMAKLLVGTDSAVEIQDVPPEEHRP